MRGDNATVTYRYRRNASPVWKIATARARVTGKRINMLPQVYDMGGRRKSHSVPPIIELISYQIDGQDVVKIR